MSDEEPDMSDLRARSPTWSRTVPIARPSLEILSVPGFSHVTEVSPRQQKPKPGTRRNYE